MCKVFPSKTSQKEFEFRGRKEFERYKRPVRQMSYESEFLFCERLFYLMLGEIDIYISRKNEQLDRVDH